MRIALFGAPGVGKGTQAKLLVQRLGLTHISTGDLIRAAIRQDSRIGKEARSYVRAGELVPGPVVRKLAEDAISSAGVDFFILDGYPRTIEQAEWLTEFLSRHSAPLEAVLSICVPDEAIVSRLSQRRMNRETGEIYHLEYHPPPPDVDPELLVQRKDDRPDAIRSRLNVYRSETLPVVQYYDRQGILHAIDGQSDIEVVYARVVSTLVEAVEQFDRRPLVES